MFHATKACFLIFVLLMLSACAPVQLAPTQPATPRPTPISPTESQSKPDQSGLPNPASVFCEDQGGKVEIRTDASGNQSGVCLFQDGSECDEWAYFRGECQPGQPQSAASPVANSRYVNDTYGFAFDPPADWSIEEYPDYLIFSRPGYKLFVGYQWTDEEIKPFRTGMPQGDFVDGGDASLLGQPLPKRILVWDGKNKVVAYGGRIKMGDLILVMYLDAVETAEVSYDALNIPPEVIAEADTIIASFALTSGEMPQLEFNPPSPGS